MRVMIYVHGHPDLKPGGSEVAAHALFQALDKLPGVEAFFLATAPDDQFSGQLSVHQLDDRGHEFLIPPLISDYFHFVGGYRNEIKWELIDLIERLEIDVLHLHHFLGLGVDTVIQIRNHFPALKMIFTAHEFLSICAHHGQMVRAKDNSLCQSAVPLRCAHCVPQRRPIDFEIRREWFRNFFDCFQAILSPSAFLAGRLIEWGLAAQKVSIVENLHPLADSFIRRPEPSSPRLNRFGFFAQLNEFKGIEVLLDAAAWLKKRDATAEIHIFGSFTTHNAAFCDGVTVRLADMSEQVHYHGGYLPKQILGLMKTVDWIVMPSIWWENAPVVIEEAKIAGRPMIVSDIGGMAEKVEHNVSGLHFPVGNAVLLAETIARVTGDRALWERLNEGRRDVAMEADIVCQHLIAYGLPPLPGTQAAA